MSTTRALRPTSTLQGRLPGLVATEDFLTPPPFWSSNKHQSIYQSLSHLISALSLGSESRSSSISLTNLSSCSKTASSAEVRLRCAMSASPAGRILLKISFPTEPSDRRTDSAAGFSAGFSAFSSELALWVNGIVSSEGASTDSARLARLLVSELRMVRERRLRSSVECCSLEGSSGDAGSPVESSCLGNENISFCYNRPFSEVVATKWQSQKLQYFCANGSNYRTRPPSLKQTS